MKNSFKLVLSSLSKDSPEHPLTIARRKSDNLKKKADKARLLFTESTQDYHNLANSLFYSRREKLCYCFDDLVIEVRKLDLKELKSISAILKRIDLINKAYQEKEAING